MIIPVTLYTLAALLLVCNAARKRHRHRSDEMQAAAIAAHEAYTARLKQMEAARKAAQQAEKKAQLDQQKAVAAAMRAEQQQEAAERRAEKAREAEERRAARLLYARELAEAKERALKAEQELRRIRSEQTPKKPFSPPAAAAKTPEPPQGIPQSFAGEVVAFTGKLSTMTRAQAIERVKAAGGKASETMPASTTILVVGQNPGMSKLDKADEWIDQVKKIREDQFLKRLETA